MHLFFCSFSQLLIDNFIDYIFILPHLSTALRKVTIAKRDFHSSGLFHAWGSEARRLLTFEKKRRHQLFKQQILQRLWLTCLYNYIANNTNYSFRSFGKNIIFMLYWIHTVKMWAYPIQYN